MKIVHTKDTMSTIYLDSLALRQEVFVHEQGVPTDIEIDRYEAECIHCVLYSNTNEVVATCRLFPLDNEQVKLQRMAVKQTYRGKDYGRLLIENAELFAKQQGYAYITLGAQATALGFYETLGYAKVGEAFTEAGIIHYPMNKKV